MKPPEDQDACPLPLLVALSGGIASGKSATAERFAQRGVPVFDADAVAHEIVAPGQPALQEIAACFGPSCITAGGELDRARLRELVFADASARAQLEAITHPRIREALRDSVRRCTNGYCVLAIPLLVEAWDDYRWVDRVLITDVPSAVQLQRLTRRPGIDAALAQRILDVQATRAQRLALAHDVIDNTAPLTFLDTVASRLHLRYLQLVAEKKRRA